MNVQPSAGAFASIYVENNPQVVWTTLVADLETPVSAMLKLADGRANAFLLESVEGGAVRGRVLRATALPPSRRVRVLRGCPVGEGRGEAHRVVPL